MRRRRLGVLSIVVRILLATSLLTCVPDTTASLEGQGTRIRRWRRTRRAKWTSMLAVDPTMVLSILVQRGGLLIPDALERDVRALRRVIRAEEASLNIVEKHLILYNLQIAMKGRKNALRIGRVFVHWDSYTMPCIVDIEVDQVDLLFEFTNLLLTRNNWNELRPALLRPTLEPVTNRLRPRVLVTNKVRSLFVACTKQQEHEQLAARHDSVVRFSSIDLSGNATVQVASRPLRKDIGTFSLDLDATDCINQKIQRLSRSNKASTDQSGCTVAELADLLQSHVGQEMQRFLVWHLEDFRSDPKSAVRKAQKALGRLNDITDSLRGYALGAGRKKRDDIQVAVDEKVDRWGSVLLSFDPVKVWNDRPVQVSNTVVKQDTGLRDRLKWLPRHQKDDSPTKKQP